MNSFGGRMFSWCRQAVLHAETQGRKGTQSRQLTGRKAYIYRYKLNPLYLLHNCLFCPVSAFTIEIKEVDTAAQILKFKLRGSII